MVTQFSRRMCAIVAGGLAFAIPVSGLAQAPVMDPGVVETAAALPPSVGLPSAPQVVHQIRGPSERMELTANSSRIVKLEQKIPKVQVNNKEILDLTPLSPNEVQIFAKKPGVTQVNLWDEVGNIHTIDVVVFVDARELEYALKATYPKANIKVRPTPNSVLLAGYVDNQEDISRIVALAEQYYPKVLNNMTVGGVQQIQLHVKVMEVSRTKLRTLGMDWAFSNGEDFVVSGVSGLIANSTATATSVSAAGDTIRFGFVDGNNSFFGFLQALRRYELLKVLAEPTLTTVSGRPANFLAGGEFPILVPQSLGTVSIQYKNYGTQVDFVPIVLGNGNIRLEVKPQVSEIDPTRSVTINGTTVPGLRTRSVDTAVEMKPGQTLALAGLVQNRVESINVGLPWLSDLPYLGIPFRKNSDTMNEIELLILVTPQYVNAVDASEVPPCGPGMHTVLPNDCDFYGRGHMETPAGPPCGPGGCGPCATGGLPAPEVERTRVYLPGTPEPIPAPTTTSAARPTSPYVAQASARTAQPTARPGDPAIVRTAGRPTNVSSSPQFIGPLGYDVSP
ncbi:MAG: type II and III secretion system protein family protein [Pirellulales bacterium]